MRTPTMIAAVAAALFCGMATAQMPEFVEAPFRVDPGVCTPARSTVYLPLGSEQIAVTGVDEAGDCVVELFAEMEGGYAQSLCRFSAEAAPIVWDPFGRRDRDVDAAWHERLQPFCETVATGNFLMPGSEPVVFPRTPWREARTATPAASD